ncbi:PREDICTED: uncharacterized protein LOC105975316 [Erythranthe guttata]|uniref:uncharacterized protein LOC105975316 n=1 Tax=Erythranthe guttata TaxID=4155 RepID=UPI00064DD1FA|nr:PREDICTED: uncharacterized protein LOC105975316 [Erythranthe guttata]|eukprot:XP_012855952.1 PREDICTED: uncharacterized protein LOC105975316 [Erythranthe guttata]
MERETEQEADERREAAIASSVSLRPNFKPKTGLTESQLSKFQELHKRRLQIKAKSKVHKRDKGDGRSKSHKKAIGIHHCIDQETSQPAVESTSVQIQESRLVNISSVEEDSVAKDSAANRRQKLHWGYLATSLSHTFRFFLFFIFSVCS